jgi:ribose 1,5-bisphosphokinase
MIGPGTLVLVVGPSGAGKDTLIGLMRALGAGQSSIVFPRRIVTRAASTHEDHDCMSGADFAKAAQAGAFALSWQAHGLSYAIPATIYSDLQRGAAAVCNVSRSVIVDARAQYASCAVVLVTAPRDVLLARVAQRNRPSDGDVARRVDRVAPTSEDIQPDIVIENVGDPATGATQLLNFVMRRAAANARLSAR